MYMKKLIGFCAILLLAGVWSIPGKAADSPAKGSGLLFNLMIEQAGHQIAPENGVFTIANQPFSFVFRLKKGAQVYANLDTEAKLAEVVANKGDLNRALDLLGYGMADEDLNKWAGAFVASEGWNVWYYESPKDHRFKSVSMEKGELIAKRYVEVLNINGKDLSLTTIDNLKLSMVYADVHFLKGQRYRIDGSECVNLVIRKQ